MRKKAASAQKALSTLEEILNEDFSLIVRDAAIQRFEYTFETIWKATKVYLSEEEGIIANSPKAVFREALTSGLLSDKQVETALKMTDDRNLTTHTYVEEVAQQIFEKLPKYYKLMKQLFEQIKETV
ncbi:MAG TPA: HI0074 family nucleotidyltransferase substrate-binding subunit [Balneolaceae bacterium]